jgi:hypothetical protein
VTNSPEEFRMYYTGAGVNINEKELAIGYAESKDGIRWEKYPRNPVYRTKDDLFLKRQGTINNVENPSLLFLDTITLIYYDYGSAINENGRIGLATVRVH